EHSFLGDGTKSGRRRVVPRWPPSSEMVEMEDFLVSHPFSQKSEKDGARRNWARVQENFRFMPCGIPPFSLKGAKRMGHGCQQRMPQASKKSAARELAHAAKDCLSTLLALC
ncbi:MAG: hypothetical protein WBL41_20085, partial [Terracidiphilus sp.]